MDEWTIRSGDLKVELGSWEESGQRSTCQAGTASSGVWGGIPAPGEPSPPFSPAHALGQSWSIAATQSQDQPWDAHGHPKMGACTQSPQLKNWREVTVLPAMQTSCLFFFFSARCGWSCYWPWPRSNPVLPNSKKKKQKMLISQGIPEDRQNHCRAGNPASKQKQITKAETNIFSLSKRKWMQNKNFNYWNWE